MADATEKLRECKARGIDTIVDPMFIGLGRYIPRIHRINEKADSILSWPLGLYTWPEVAFDAPEPLVDGFVKDIREGIADTGVKAAFLKCAIEKQGPYARRRAGDGRGRTCSSRDGVPITVHTNAHTQSGLWPRRCSRRSAPI